jgi:hypothetical protein
MPGEAYTIIMNRWPLLVLCSAACSTVPAARQEKPILSPALATTAGGTWVTLENIPFNLKAPRVELGMRDRLGREVVAWLPAEGEKTMDKRTLRFQTPRFVEDCANVRITDGGRECLMPNALCFQTLAFTANQGTNNSSVVDTYNNAAFTPSPSMPFGAGFIPVSLAYNIAYPPARVLYALDKTSGDMSYYDASNFVKSGDVPLQYPDSFPEAPKAFDQALFNDDGWQGFVSHVTSGAETYTANPIPGGLSWLEFDEYGVPTLKDVDDDCETTSPGAPEGFTRVKLCDGDPGDCEEGYNAYFYPLSVKIVTLSVDVPDYSPQDREPWPGTYAFVSGVGYLEDEQEEREAMVAVLDLNPALYCDPSAHPRDPNYCTTLDIWDCNSPSDYCNSRWWRKLQYDGGPANYKALFAGVDTSELGDTKHAMDFAPDAGLETDYPPDPPRDVILGPTLYVLDEDYDEDYGVAYLFNYDTTSYDWVPVEEGGGGSFMRGNVFTIPTGDEPTGIKVQKVKKSTVDYLLAYITNAVDDNVTVVDTETNLYAPESPIDLDYCYAGNNHPTSFDTRNSEYLRFGYSSNSNSDSVSVFDLVGGTCESASDNGAIELEDTSAPAEIVVQPVPDSSEIFEQMMGMMVFSEPENYTTHGDKDGMLGDWKAINQLVLTPASPQAIKAAINAFLNKIDQKVTKDKLKKHLKQGVKLYKVAYTRNHPGN